MDTLYAEVTPIVTDYRHALRRATAVVLSMGSGIDGELSAGDPLFAVRKTLWGANWTGSTLDLREHAISLDPTSSNPDEAKFSTKTPTLDHYLKAMLRKGPSTGGRFDPAR